MSRPHRSTSALVLGAAILLAVPRVHAGVLYQTGFEPPVFVVGPLAGQDGFSSVFGASAGEVTTTAPASGTQSVQIFGERLEDVGGGFLLADFPRPIPGAGGAAIVEVAADVRLDGPLAGLRLLSVNLAAFNADGDTLGDFSIGSDGTALGLTDPFGVDFVTAPAALGAYFRLAMRINASAGTTEFFLNGSSIGVLAIPGSLSSTTLDSISLAMVSTDTLSETAQYTGFFDNLSVTAATPIPEPPGVVLMGLGLCGLLVVARVRR